MRGSFECLLSCEIEHVLHTDVSHLVLNNGPSISSQRFALNAQNRDNKQHLEMTRGNQKLCKQK